MAHVRTTILATLIFTLAGCVAPEPPRDTVNIVGDQFAKGITLNGIPAVNQDDPGLSWMIQSLVDPNTGQTDHGIQAVWVYEGHSMGKYTAADDRARPLPVKTIFKDACAFGGCPTTVTLDIGIDEATLRARANTGFEIKLMAQDGSWAILDITPHMINAQLEAMNRVLGGRPSHDSYASRSSPPVLNLPYNPNAPGAQVAPPYSLQDSGIGISGIPMPGSKISPLQADGLMVSNVVRGSPADAAGIKLGDVLTSFNGHSLTNIMTAVDVFKAAASDAMAKAKPGNSIPVELVRGGKHMSLVIHL